jgi:hypothetical protein
VVSELRDHALVLGKVIDGKLVDSEAEPMCYRETGAMDGASTLYPDVFGHSRSRSPDREHWGPACHGIGDQVLVRAVVSACPGRCFSTPANWPIR